MAIAKLGVNVDHVATVRQARGEFYPEVTRAARLVLENGADQITIHLREDRRHIQDADVPAVKKITDEFKKPLNLEMGCAREIIDIGLKVKPEWVCLVPEKREERTTEGGLNLKDCENAKKVSEAIKEFKAAGIKVSLFLEADLETLKIAQEMECEAVEIHTGDYAKKFLEKKSIEEDLEKFRAANKFLNDAGILCHAGHGLTDESVAPLLKEKLFVEYNIGHWIIAEGIFEGIGLTTKKLADQFREYPL